MIHGHYTPTQVDQQPRARRFAKSLHILENLLPQLNAPISTWPMAGMRASTKGMAPSPHLRSADDSTLDTPSSTSSSASFSSCARVQDV